MVRPQIKQTRRGVMISHREYVGDAISAGTTFSICASVVISACNPTLFPWLSQIAPMYQKYRFHSMRIGYSSEQPTTAAGIVIVCTTDNANAPAPTGKQQMLESSDALKTNVWAPAFYPVRVPSGYKLCQYGEPGSPGYSTQTGNTVTTGYNSSANEYSVGRYWVAVNGVASGIAGELWIDYTVELVDAAPMPYPPTIASHVEVTSSAATTPFDVLASVTTRGTLAITFPTSTTMTFLAPGPFVMHCTAPTGSATAATTVTASAGTLTAIGNGIGAGGFSFGYVWTNTTYPQTLTLTMASFTNLNASGGFPLRIYITSYDSTNMKMTLN